MFTCYFRTKKVKELLENLGEKDLTEEIVKVTTNDRLKRALYILKDELPKIKSLKLSDLTTTIRI